MFAGHDTTASALAFTMYCLACNPEHQKKCRDEVMQVLDSKDSLDWCVEIVSLNFWHSPICVCFDFCFVFFQREDLSKIPYTTMCIKESLRLYPPVPEIARTLTKPMTFCDGRSLPAGLFLVGFLSLVLTCMVKSALFKNSCNFQGVKLFLSSHFKSCMLTFN